VSQLCPQTRCGTTARYAPIGCPSQLAVSLRPLARPGRARSLRYLSRPRCRCIRRRLSAERQGCVRPPPGRLRNRYARVKPGLVWLDAHKRRDSSGVSSRLTIGPSVSRWSGVYALSGLFSSQSAHLPGLRCDVQTCTGLNRPSENVHIPRDCFFRIPFFSPGPTARTLPGNSAALLHRRLFPDRSLLPEPNALTVLPRHFAMLL
jgi:hypothetical protein